MDIQLICVLALAAASVCGLTMMTRTIEADVRSVAIGAFVIALIVAVAGSLVASS